MRKIVHTTCSVILYIIKIVLTTHSAIVLHVSVLCNKNCPRYSQCYSITCIRSMLQKLSSLHANRVLLCDRLSPYINRVVFWMLRIDLKWAENVAWTYRWCFFIMWINNNLFYCVYLIIIIFFIFLKCSCYLKMVLSHLIYSLS